MKLSEQKTYHFFLYEYIPFLESLLVQPYVKENKKLSPKKLRKSFI